MARLGSIKTDHYGPVALYHYRTRNPQPTECDYGVIFHGTTYVNVEMCTPESTVTASMNRPSVS